MTDDQKIKRDADALAGKISSMTRDQAIGLVQHGYKPKIYIISQNVPGGCIGFALAQDGVGLAEHLSSSSVYLRYDMGLTSTRKHNLYEFHYPEGYELVDYIDATDEELERDKTFVRAYNINNAKDQP